MKSANKNITNTRPWPGADIANAKRSQVMKQQLDRKRGGEAKDEQASSRPAPLALRRCSVLDS